MAFPDRNHPDRPGHVGIVVGVGTNRHGQPVLRTIEGNTWRTPGQEGVMERVHNLSEVFGYGRLNDNSTTEVSP